MKSKKFQLDISKLLPARRENINYMECEYGTVNVNVLYLVIKGIHTIVYIIYIPNITVLVT